MVRQFEGRIVKSGPKSKGTAVDGAPEGFSDEERAAIREYAQERRSQGRRGSRTEKTDGERDVVAKIAEMTEPDRTMAARVHDIIRANAPDLEPRTWYGMPAYAKDGNVMCFFQGSQKFKSRYATIGFSDKAQLDDGAMWATSYALVELTAKEEEAIAVLVKRAIS